MRSFDIGRGSTVEANGRRYIVSNDVLGFDEVEARDVETGRYHRVAIADLREPRDEVATQIVPDLSEIDSAAFAEAKGRADAVRRLLSLPRCRRADVAACAEDFGVCVATVYNWMRAYRDDGRLSSLIPAKRGGGRGRSRVDNDVERILRAAIEKHYLQKEEPTARSTFREVTRMCRAAELAPPCESTVRARIRAIPEKKRMRQRGHSKAASDLFDARPGKFLDAEHPLAIVQIDHTELDVVLVDEEHRLPLKRPWLTLAFDVYSRMVLGFYISFEAPGAHGTGLCLARAILPKEMWLSKYGIKHNWPCWGFPHTIHADNAKEFRGEMLRRACDQYNMHLEFRPIATPEFGGHIERMMDTLAKEIHNLPGATRKPGAKGDYDPEASAVLTLAEFEEQITVYITSVYHQRFHSGIKMSPRKRWDDAILAAGQIPRPADPERLLLDFTPVIERTIQPYGVQIDDIRYYSDVLRHYVRASRNGSRSFTFRRDPRDISTIFFWDPDVGEYYAIPYRNVTHPPMSVWELRTVKKHLEQEGRANIDESAIFEAYDRMREHQETAKAKTKLVRRLAERRKKLAREPRSALKPLSTVSVITDEAAAPSEVVARRFEHIEPLEVYNE